MTCRHVTVRREECARGENGVEFPTFAGSRGEVSESLRVVGLSRRTHREAKAGGRDEGAPGRAAQGCCVHARVRMYMRRGLRGARIEVIVDSPSHVVVGDRMESEVEHREDQNPEKPARKRQRAEESPAERSRRGSRESGHSMDLTRDRDLSDLPRRG